MRLHPVVGAVSILFLMGCQRAAAVDDVAGEEETESAAAALEFLPGSTFLFETFGGNGRTCGTCHPLGTGTVSPLAANLRFNLNPNDPLFRTIDSDNGNSNTYNRLRSVATILVPISLPLGVTLAGDPSATSVTLERGIPTTLNTPALDPVLMLDGRAPSLEAQALDAVHTHAQPTVEPTAAKLADIVDFEENLFSSLALKQYADGGPAPTLPEGSTESEQRGRKFFEAQPFAPPSLHGFCGFCHSGPMLNTVNEFNPGLPQGTRFADVLVSEINPRGLPLRTFDFGGTLVTSPDPGRALITGNAADANTFKIPSLWGLRRTAPYFHDNSAATLEDVAAHYNTAILLFFGGAFSLSEQDQADIVAFMKLL